MKNYSKPSLLAINLQRFFDVGIIIIAGYATLHMRFGNLPVPNDFYDKCILGSGLFFLFISSSYTNTRSLNSQLRAISVLTQQWLFCFIGLIFLIIFTQSGNLISRIWLGSWGLASWLLLIFSHLFTHFLFNKLISRTTPRKRIALIGNGNIASQLIGRLSSPSTTEYELVAHLKTLDQEQLKGLAKETLDEIWITLPITEANQLSLAIKNLEHSAANIKYAPDLFTLRLINHGSSEVFGIEMLNLNSSPFLGEALILKNLEDFVLSSLILIAISPLMLLLAIGVKFTSPGPIFYRQERVGLNGKVFQMLKFRSMPVDIEKDGARWGGSESKVISPFAKWMRQLNLDELPQFINVMRGEMSIVGPRPERSEFIDQFKEQIPNYMKKHLVKAGITGWAQVHGLRGDTDLNERIEYDLYYIENWSLNLDLKIILLTALQTLGIKKYT